MVEHVDEVVARRRITGGREVMTRKCSGWELEPEPELEFERKEFSGTEHGLLRIRFAFLFLICTSIAEWIA